MSTLMALAGVLAIWSCNRPQPEQGKQDAPTSQSPAPLAAGELALFDRLTTLETIFPESSDRDLYTAGEAVVENGERSYTFTLKPQPGMDAARHFQIVTVAWARPGAFANTRTGGAGVSGTGGPGGGFVEKVAQTPDRAYDVRVALGELLPNTAKTPALDLDALVQRLLDEYTKVKSRQP
jgi:hypothetical protein